MVDRMSETQSNDMLQQRISKLEDELGCLKDKHQQVLNQNKRIDQEHRQLQSRLQKIHRMEAIGTLAGGIAHDFNNILASLIGFTELVLEDVEKGSLLEDNLQEVYLASKRAKELVKQILTFTREEETIVKPIRVDILTKEVLKFMRSAIPSSISIAKNIHNDKLVKGDPINIHHILVALCTNAAQAMEADGGVLNLTLSDVRLEPANTAGLPPGDYVELVVTDTGPGIAQDRLERLFDPEAIPDNDPLRPGVNLSTVREIVRKLDGEIQVQSREGYGSVFRVHLPAEENELETYYHRRPLPTGHEHILWLDDESPITRMGRQFLEGLGYKVTIQTDSEATLELITRNPEAVDAVITDMTMPGISGDLLTAHIRAVNPTLPIILLTGFSTHMNQDKADALGIQAFLTKPLSTQQLATTLRQVLDAGKLTDASP
jgi:signal transduction histidine kinase/ActR/RegA family two-component response regulator